MRLTIPFVSFLKRGPLGHAACSEGLKKGIIFQLHVQDGEIGRLQELGCFNLRCSETLPYDNSKYHYSNLQVHNY